MEELFFLAIATPLCGCDSWESIDLFGKTKLDWFGQYFPYRLNKFRKQIFPDT
jgi:hypothetical protein